MAVILLYLHRPGHPCSLLLLHHSHRHPRLYRLGSLPCSPQASSCLAWQRQRKSADGTAFCMRSARQNCNAVQSSCKLVKNTSSFRNDAMMSRLLLRALHDPQQESPPCHDQSLQDSDGAPVEPLTRQVVW